MNISELAKANKVSTDTIRYYEKQGILLAPVRQENGYRSYTEAHVDLLRFVRMAQSLGFSLAEIRAILPQFTEGTLERGDIEQQLQRKMKQIDAHIKQLHTLKKDLRAAFDTLDCDRGRITCTAHEMPLPAAETIAKARRNKFTPLERFS